MYVHVADSDIFSLITFQLYQLMLEDTQVKNVYWSFFSVFLKLFYSLLIMNSDKIDKKDVRLADKIYMYISSFLAIKYNKNLQIQTEIFGLKTAF